MKKLIVLLAFSVLISACSNNETTKKEKEEESSVEVANEEKETKEEEKVDYPEASKDPEQIVLQHMGIKTEEALTLMENAKDVSEWDGVMEEFQVDEMDSTEIYNGLIYSFGLDYTNTYSPLANYQPDYGEYDIAKKEEAFKNIAIHLDSSGSMAAYVPGGIKMDLAKQAIKKYASGLPIDSVISLRVYGHKGTGSDSDKSLSCSSTEVMYAANAYNDAGFSDALTKFKPSGWTPLAASIKGAYDDLKPKAVEGSENILFVVSDGIETCDGNPVEEAKKLANSDLNVKVHIIGFAVDDEGQKQLKQTAEAGNGTYYTVNDNVELTNTISELLQDAQEKTQQNFDKAKSGYAINMQSVENGGQIDELTASFGDAIFEEKRVLNEILQQLIAREKVSQEDAEAIRVLIEERHEALSEYKDLLRSDAVERNKAKREEIFESLN